MKTAIVLGATGLVGQNIVKILLDDPRYSKIKIFVRRATGMKHPKLEENLVDFDALDGWKRLLSGDELFSAMGTTAKDAGSKEAQNKVDYTYQYQVAKACAENEVSSYFLVSSSGADPKSQIFYSRIKGELEVAVSKLAFENIAIFQPSVLLGKRERPRFLEEIAGKFTIFLTQKLHLLKRYRPIKGADVAQAMVNAANWERKERFARYELNEIHEMCGVQK